MESMENLRARLVAYVRKKFYTRRGIANVADDIVNQAFLSVAASPRFTAELYNFGYMSKACIRGAYKVFHQSGDEGSRLVTLSMAVPLIDEDCFVEEIVQAEDTAAVVASLQILKDVEQVIIRERYYGEFTFREISERHGINLNTVLTHHRRALNKLRPMLVNLCNTKI
jgi:RNA polymerase sigma factor (sigma-70 family)